MSYFNDELTDMARKYSVHDDIDKMTHAHATTLKILEDARFDTGDAEIRKALTHLLEITEGLTK